MILETEDKKVLELLKKENKPLKSGEIADLMGIDKDLVNKSITRLKKSGDIESPKRCFYSAK
jgi:predicted transcriptional regulator